MSEIFKVKTKEEVHKFIENNYGIDRGGVFEAPCFEDSHFKYSCFSPQWMIEDCPVDLKAWQETRDDYDIVYHDKSRSMVQMTCIPSQNYYCVENLGRTRIKKEEKEEILQRLEKAKHFLFALCVSLRSKGE